MSSTTERKRGRLEDSDSEGVQVEFPRKSGTISLKYVDFNGLQSSIARTLRFVSITEEKENVHIIKMNTARLSFIFSLRTKNNKMNMELLEGTLDDCPLHYETHGPHIIHIKCFDRHDFLCILEIQ